MRLKVSSRSGGGLALGLAAVFVTSCAGPAYNLKRPKQKVTVGIQVSPAMTLIMVAKEKGFFLDEGADVELKEFTAGKFALQAFLSGSIDFAVSGEVPVALATLQGNPIRVVTQVVEKTTNEVRVIARKDDSATQPSDYFKLTKRKLATSFGGGPEFYTYNFLRHYGIRDNEIEILSQRPEDMPAGLATHSVDAIAIFDPFAFLAEKRLGSQVVTFSDPQLYSEIYVLNARPDQMDKNSSLIEGMLRALDKSAGFIASDPESSKIILQKYTKLDRDVIDGIWNNFSFRPALTPELIDVWKAEEAWARDTGKVGAQVPHPDFRKIIEDRFLRRVKPDAVKF